MSIVMWLAICTRAVATLWLGVVWWKHRDLRLGFLLAIYVLAVARMWMTVAVAPAPLTDPRALQLQWMDDLSSLTFSLLMLGSVAVFTRVWKEPLEERAKFHASEERFRILAENIPGVVYLCRNDERYTVLYLNDNIAGLTGYSAQDFLNNRTSFVELSHPDDIAAIRGKVDAALHARRPFHLQYRLRHRDGRWLWIHEVGVGVWEDETLVYLEGFLEDITERKRIESEAAAAQQELLDRQQREKELIAAELAAARDELIASTRLATIGKMSAQIAHDIRNPLAAILNSASYVKRQLDLDQAKPREALELIAEEVQICNRIVSNLLGATQTKPPRRELLELDVLIRRVCGRLQMTEGVQVTIRTDPEPFDIYADPLQFSQVFDNLLKNAVDAVGLNGVIEVTAVRNGGIDCITIHDTGPGIPHAQWETVFEMFFTTKANGTGLGLGICRNIIELHGGTLEIVDGNEPGTTVRLKLPRVTEHCPPVTGVTPSESVASSG